MNEYQKRALDTLAELCNLFPEKRLGQIIYEFVLTKNNNDSFYLSDKNFCEILEKKELEVREKQIQRRIKKVVGKNPVVMSHILEIIEKYEKNIDNK